MSLRFLIWFKIAFGMMCLGFASALFADENRIFLLQSGTYSVQSNSFWVDQRNAANSVVTGPNLLPQLSDQIGLQKAAVQVGGDNNARIGLQGTGHEVSFVQQGQRSGRALTSGFRNFARIRVEGQDHGAELVQMGHDNRALITLHPGTGSFVKLRQRGDHNLGDVQVFGSNAHGTLIQNGDNLQSQLTVHGHGAHVTYQLTGNNISAPSGVQVVTNISSSAPITVTQTR